MSRARRAKSPLPQQFGVDAARLVLPAGVGGAGWATLGDHLRERLPLSDHALQALFTAGKVVDRDGRALSDDTPYRRGDTVWVDRDLAPETAVPSPMPVVHRDERLLVVDKPPFLASMPRGRHITQSALARARHELGLPDLALAHRLDRLTSGLLVMVLDPALRGAYHALFARREVTKTYLAVAPVRADLEVPVTVRSHLVKRDGDLRATTVPDLPPNSETHVELLDQREGLGLYRLTPTTGKTHQLRAHLAGLGIPIVNDPLFPDVRPDLADLDDDFSKPLQLLAHRLALTDPVSGSRLDLVSGQGLAAWPDLVAPTAHDL